MADKIQIKIIDDGPVKISGCESLKYCGEVLDTGIDVYLCRCGESKNQPFCDGSHGRCGFSGRNEKNSESKVVTWQGHNIRTYFNKNICMHVFYCQPLKSLREKELSGDVVAADEIKSVIKKCPSGALSYDENTDSSMSEFSDVDCVDVVEAGEIRIQSAFDCDEIVLQEKQPGNRVTLCRCGLSKNKPFCDGRHRKKEDFR